jgi:Protein of unknown function (DUF4232)
MYPSARIFGRRTLAAAVLTCLGMLTAACAATSSPSAASSGTTPATATATATPAPSPSSQLPASGGATASGAGAPASSAVPAAAGGPTPCPTRSLSAKTGLSQGTAGSIYTVIDFTNISNTTCTLDGYPGVSLAGGKPVTQIGLAAKENGTAPRTVVTLAPGAVGNALLQIADAANYPTATCDPATADYLQIYPPNQTTPIYLAYSTQTCSKPVQILTVGVVQTGSGGQ